MDDNVNVSSTKCALLCAVLLPPNCRYSHAELQIGRDESRDADYN